MLITHGLGPAVPEMKSTASRRRTELPKLSKLLRLPLLSRSARWTQMRSASGAMPTGPPAWPFPAAMSRTWVPCAPSPAWSAVAGWYPSRWYGCGLRSAASICSRSWTVPYPYGSGRGPGAASRWSHRAMNRVPPGRRPSPAVAWSAGQRNAAESTSTPQSVDATTTLLPVSVSPGPRRISVGRGPGGRETPGGADPGLSPRAALMLITSGRARTPMTSCKGSRQVTIVPKRETIRTPGISMPGLASRMIASISWSPPAPASARSNSHRAGSTAHSPVNSDQDFRFSAPALLLLLRGFLGFFGFVSATFDGAA